MDSSREPGRQHPWRGPGRRQQADAITSRPPRPVAQRDRMNAAGPRRQQVWSLAKSATSTPTARRLAQRCCRGGSRHRGVRRTGRAGHIDEGGTGHAPAQPAHSRRLPAVAMETRIDPADRRNHTSIRTSPSTSRRNGTIVEARGHRSRTVRFGGHNGSIISVRRKHRPANRNPEHAARNVLHDPVTPLVMIAHEHSSDHSNPTNNGRRPARPDS